MKNGKQGQMRELQWAGVLIEVTLAETTNGRNISSLVLFLREPSQTEALIMGQNVPERQCYSKYGAWTRCSAPHWECSTPTGEGRASRQRSQKPQQQSVIEGTSKQVTVPQSFIFTVFSKRIRPQCVGNRRRRHWSFGTGSLQSPAEKPKI